MSVEPTTPNAERIEEIRALTPAHGLIEAGRAISDLMAALDAANAKVSRLKAEGGYEMLKAYEEEVARLKAAIPTEAMVRAAAVGIIYAETMAAQREGRLLLDGEIAAIIRRAFNMPTPEPTPGEL
jgi:hypothetical protein